MQEFHFLVCVRAKREVLIALFCEESLEKIDAKDVELIRNGVGPRILSLQSVHYLGTSEYFSKNFDGVATDKPS